MLFAQKDPLKIVRNKLQIEKDRLRKLEDEVGEEIRAAIARALLSPKAVGKKGRQ